MRGVLEWEVNSWPYNIKEALKAAIRYAMANMEREAVAKTCSSFRSYLEKVAGVDGCHIEWFLYLIYIWLTMYKISIFSIYYFVVQKTLFLLSIPFSGFICTTLFYRVRFKYRQDIFFFNIVFGGFLWDFVWSFLEFTFVFLSIPFPLSTFHFVLCTPQDLWSPNHHSPS